MTRDLVLVAISLFAWGFGEGMFWFFQPLYLEKWGADPLTIGAILGGVGIAMTVAHLPAGYLSDRIGQRPIMWIAWFMGILATGIMAMAGSLGAFVAGMLIYGLTSFVSAPLNSYIAAARGKMRVGRALTVVQSFYNFGAVLGPTAGGLIAEKISLAAIYQAAFVFFVISTAVILLIRKQVNTPAPHEIAPAAPILHNKRFLIFLPFVLLTTFSTYLPQPFTPNFLQNQRHLTLGEIGGLGSFSSFGTAILALSLGSLNPIAGLIAGQALVAMYAVLIWQGTNLGWYGIGFFCIGGFRLARSLILAFTRTLIDTRLTGIAFGFVEMVNGLAVFAAPRLAGYLYNQEPASVYLVALIAIALSLLVNLTGLPFLQRKAQAASKISAANAPL
jgi:MFS family permease